MVTSLVVHELDVLVSNTRTWKMEAGRQGIQDYPWLESKSEASLGHIKSYLKK